MSGYMQDAILNFSCTIFVNRNENFPN